MTLAQKEAEANAFAFELLMPASMVRARVKKPISEGQITALAKEFQVSEVVMTLRLVDMGFIRKRGGR